MSVEQMPALNASLNGLATVFLILGYFLIKKGNRKAHKISMLAAFSTSTILLACYLYYHFTVEAVTRFTNPAWFKPYYLILLFTHVDLAVVMLPFIFKALWNAYKGQFEQHKKVVKWAWPMWLYVSITGVLVYLILYQIFPQK